MRDDPKGLCFHWQRLHAARMELVRMAKVDLEAAYSKAVDIQDVTSKQTPRQAAGDIQAHTRRALDLLTTFLG